MKFLFGFVVLAVLVIGCASNTSVPESQATEHGAQGAQRMPGGVGLSAGESGTGTTSGASTGY